jgi:phage N-6-adenine-methyltransferase
MNRILFSSHTDEWATPPDFFTKMARRYGPFDLDVCALPDNAKCPHYFTPEVDGLKKPWRGRCWCNPPYGKTIGRWVRKAWESSVDGATVVMLLPARVDTRWWHDLVKPYATKIHFIRGRLRFGNSEHPAPSPSVVVVFAPGRLSRCQWCERPYKPARTDAKFCSAGCKQAAYRARRVTDIAVTSQQAAGITPNTTPPRPCLYGLAVQS